MPPLVRASLGLHAFAVAASMAAPHSWPWLLSGVALNHALIAGLGLWPRSEALGRNATRLSDLSAARGDIALTIDDGPHPTLTPRVLDVLDIYQAKATFFCIARQAQRYPALTREIVARGHSVQNHTYGHRHTFSLWGPRAIAAEVQRAQDTLSDITGQRPLCFRAPAGLRNVFLDPVLHRLGLTLVSWTRRGFDTRDADARRVTARLTRGLRGGDILLLHDGNGALSADRRPVVMHVLPALLNHIREARLQCVTLPQAFVDSSIGRLDDSL